MQAKDRTIITAAFCRSIAGELHDNTASSEFSLQAADYWRKLKLEL